jgi:Tol biopolymer transport system component
MRLGLWLTAFCAIWAAGGVRTRLVWSGEAVTLLGSPSRDGRYLSCIDPETRALALRSVTGGPIKRLFDHSASSGEFAYFSVPSPDGSQIAFAWFNARKFYDLRVVAESGGEPRVLLQNEEAGFVQPTAWTPDGKWILTLLFRRDNISQIALVHAATREVKVLRSLNWVYPKKMDISPDGRWIVYDSFAAERAGQRDLYVLAVDGSRETKLVEHPAEDLFPVWSPDGSEVAFASDRSGTLDAWAIRVKEGRPDGEPRLLKTGLGRFLPMGVTRDGSLYYGVRGSEPPVGFHAAPGTPVGRVAFLARRGPENYGEPARVLVIREPSGAARELDVKLAHMEKLRWSPDGEWLLVSGSDGKGRAGLYRVRVEDGSVRPVVWDAEAGYRGVEGVWLDGRRVAYLRGGSLFERDLDTGEEKQFDAGGAHALAYGKAGLAMATSTEVYVRETGRRWRVRGIEQVEWLGDDLVVTRGSSAAVLTASGLRELELARYAGGALSVSADGRALAYPCRGASEEVWVMENVWAPVAAR